ncbi:MAG: hypothetical protein EXS63_08415 [Candidatus Omnitrophica bacterium]|nr:hypothetical protein [Candidatus Omnitrophota bacterium]
MSANKVTGDVTIVRGELTLKADNGTSFLEKDKIITGNDGSVDIVANDQWGIRIMPLTEAVLVLAQERETHIEMLSGDILFSIRPLGKDEKFTVETPTASLAVHSTKFWGRVTPKNVLSAGTVALKEGTVEIQLKELEIPITLNEGEATDLPVGYAFAEVRTASEYETALMEKIDEIPLFLMKANIGHQLDLLRNLDRLSKASKAKSAPPASSKKEKVD